MIHQTITFVAITTLHLAFVTSIMEIYRTDAAIWSQTETTADWQNHSSGTAYQQIAATNLPESVTNVASTVHNQLNVSLENLVSAFNIPSYVGNCSDLQEQTDADEFHYISYDGDFPDELLRTTREMYADFNTFIQTALLFICTENTSVGHEVISVARIYAHNFTEFMVRLNGSAAAIGEVAVLDTVSDLYRTSIQQVQSVRELVEHVTEMISVEGKFNAMKIIILQQSEALNFFYEPLVLEIVVGKQNELVSLLQNISERAGNMSERTDGNPFINVIRSGWIWRFLDVQYWTELLQKDTNVLVLYETKLYDTQYWQFLTYKEAPVILEIFLVVGMTGHC